MFPRLKVLEVLATRNHTMKMPMNRVTSSVITSSSFAYGKKLPNKKSPRLAGSFIVFA